MFAAKGGYTSPQAFVDGLIPAVWVGAAFVGLGAIAALAIPSRRRAGEIRIEVPAVASGRLADGALAPERVLAD